MISAASRALPLLVAIGCTPTAPDGRIFVQITGDDGAATGQVGTISIASDGTYRCVMQSPDVLGNVTPDPIVRIGQAQTLYATLDILIRTNARDGFRDPSADIAEVTGPGGTIAVLPGTEFNGLTSPLAARFVGVINAATQPDCLPFG